MQHSALLEVATTKPCMAEPANKADILPITSLGGGLRLAKQEQINLTIPDAESFLQLTAMEYERPLRDNHVERLSKHMKQGTFRPEFVNLITCQVEENKTKYRMNGQHTCWARTFMPPTYPCKVNTTHYIAKTIHDARQLYATIDRAAPRTKDHIIQAYLGGTTEYAEFPKKVIGLAASGLVFFLCPEVGTDRAVIEPDEVAYLLKTEYADLANQVMSFYGKVVWSRDRHLMRSPIAAAMYATFSKAAKQSREFWEGVRTGVGLASAQDPRLKLRNQLMTSAISSSGSTHLKGVKHVSQLDMYAYAINAWNCFREGQPCNILRGQYGGKAPKAK